MSLPELLFVGTEFGVFFSVDAGGQWTKLSGGAPNIAFRDLAIQQRESDLVGATFGRSFYVLDDYSPLRSVTAELLSEGSVLFPVRRVHWYVPKRPHSCAEAGCVDSQGDAYFVAPNPPFGAVFTYYLADARKSRKERRAEAEKELKKTNENVTFPPWDALDAEALESEPAIVFTVSDTDGNVVRHVEAPAKAGFQRVAWDLRYPVVEPWLPEAERGKSFGTPAGVLVAPGRYEVAMFERIDGELRDLGQRQAFDVVSIRTPTLPGSSQQERVTFSRRVDEMRRAVNGTLKSIDEVLVQLDAIREMLASSTADMALYTAADSLRKRTISERDRLSGNQTMGEYAVIRPMPISARLSHAAYDPNTTAHGPTATQRDSLSIAEDEYAEIGDRLTRLIDEEYPALIETLDRAGVPWTPGRGVLVPNQDR